MQPLQCGSQHQLANLHMSTHRTTPEHQMTTVMQPFHCDLQPEIPKHPKTTHTQARPKAASSHRYTAGEKKDDKPTAAAPVAHTRYLSSSAAATLHGKTQGFVLRLPPQNIAHATSCSHYNAVRSIINSQTCTCLRTEQHQNTKWQQSCSHFQCDLPPEIPKHPITTHTHKHTQSSFKPPLHCGKKNDKPTAAAPVAHTRYLFIVACSHFTRKKKRFRAPASSPKHSPCNIMQPWQWGFAASTRKLAHVYAQNNSTRTPDDNSHAAIPMRSATGDSKTPYNYAHTSTPKAASSHRYTAAKKKTTNRPQPHPSHTRGYLSSSPAATLHGKTQGFVLRLPPQLTTCLRHRFPSSPLPIVTTSLRHHFPSSSLPIVTTPHRQQLPSSTSLPHHFPSSPLPFVTTSLRHHFPTSPLPFVTTSLRHHFPSSPLPFITTSLCHHFPSSPLPFVTTSLHHHFPSSPLPIVTTSLRHHPLS